MIGHSSILDVTSLWGYSYMWCWRRYHAQWAGSCWLHRIGQGMSCSELLLRKLLLLWELSALCFSMAVEQESDQNPSATTRSNGLGIKTAAICWEWCSILAHLQTQLCCMVSYICHKVRITTKWCVYTLLNINNLYLLTGNSILQWLTVLAWSSFKVPSGC